MSRRLVCFPGRNILVIDIERQAALGPCGPGVVLKDMPWPSKTNRWSPPTLNRIARDEGCWHIRVVEHKFHGKGGQRPMQVKTEWVTWGMSQ